MIILYRYNKHIIFYIYRDDVISGRLRPRHLVPYHRGVDFEKGLPHTRMDTPLTQREFDDRAKVHNRDPKQISVSNQALFAEHVQLTVPNRQISNVTGQHHPK